MAALAAAALREKRRQRQATGDSLQRPGAALGRRAVSALESEAGDSVVSGRVPESRRSSASWKDYRAGIRDEVSRVNASECARLVRISARDPAAEASIVFLFADRLFLLRAAASRVRPRLAHQRHARGRRANRPGRAGRASSPPPVGRALARALVSRRGRRSPRVGRGGPLSRALPAQAGGFAAPRRGPGHARWTRRPALAGCGLQQRALHSPSSAERAAPSRRRRRRTRARALTGGRASGAASSLAAVVAGRPRRAQGLAPRPPARGESEVGRFRPPAAAAMG